MPFSLRISLRSQLQITALKGCFSNSFIFFICRSCSSSLVLKPMTVIDWLISLLPSSTLHFYNALITMISTFISGDRWISCIYDCLLCMDFFFFFKEQRIAFPVYSPSHTFKAVSHVLSTINALDSLEYMLWIYNSLVQKVFWDINFVIQFILLELWAK